MEKNRTNKANFVDVVWALWVRGDFEGRFRASRGEVLRLGGNGRSTDNQGHEMGPIPVLAGIGVRIAGGVDLRPVGGHPGLPGGVLPFIVADNMVAVYGNAVGVDRER